MIRRIKRLLSFFLQRADILRGDIHRNDRYGALFRAWGYIFSNHLKGDYVEFGVYRGDSVIHSLNAFKKFSKWLQEQHQSEEKWRRDVARQSPLNQHPIFHCLDTFEGMPENDEGFISFEAGCFLSDFEATRNRISKHNTEKIQINYYKGLFSNTATEFQDMIKGRNIAIAHIDCDLCESTRDALVAIEDNIDIGSVLLFDDYNHFNADMNKGQRKAFSDFQNDSKYIFEKFFSYHSAGQAFLVIGRK